MTCRLFFWGCADAERGDLASGMLLVMVILSPLGVRERIFRQLSSFILLSSGDNGAMKNGCADRQGGNGREETASV